MTIKHPVDAVITWVDGKDSQHESKLLSYLNKHGLARPESAASTRYNQCGELKYCLYSLLKFAPWLRNIYLVTDAQRPDFFSELPAKVKIVDHREIFFQYENYLPTFSSLAIETMLWRIPDLAEHFIYLNDDCMLLKPVGYEDFFQESKPVVRGNWKTQFKYSLRKYFSNLEDYRKIQENSAILAGFTRKFFSLPHTPFALRTSTFAGYFAKNPKLLESNIRHPFRNSEQFWPISLAYHLEWQAKSLIVDSKLKALYLNPSIHSLDKIQARISKDNSFACIQSLDLASLEVREYLFSWLNSLLESGSREQVAGRRRGT